MDALAELSRIAEALPEGEVVAHGRHAQLAVRGRILAWLTDDLVTGSYRLVAQKRQTARL